MTADFRPDSDQRRSSSRLNHCLDGCVREKFDPMDPDEFADYVASNPLDGPKVFYYLSICGVKRNQALMEGFGRHPYFTQEPCRCYGKPQRPILDLITSEPGALLDPVSV